MKKTVLILALILLTAGVSRAELPWVPLADPPVAEKELDLSGIVVGKEVPETYDLPASVMELARTLRAGADIAPKIAQRETDYSWYWMSKALRSHFLPASLKKGIVLVPGINGRDDGAFLSYTIRLRTSSSPAYRFALIDARDLIVMVSGPGLSRETPRDIAATFLHTDRLGARKDAVSRVNVTKTVQLSHGRSCGIIGLDACWYVQPIEWYRDQDRMIFLIRKDIGEIPAQGLAPAYMVIGGIPRTDSRPWLRFDQPNRESLSEEYIRPRRASDFRLQ